MVWLRCSVVSTVGFLLGDPVSIISVHVDESGFVYFPLEGKRWNSSRQCGHISSTNRVLVHENPCVDDTSGAGVEDMVAEVVMLPVLGGWVGTKTVEEGKQRNGNRDGGLEEIFDAYVAGKENAPGIIVLQEWWGVDFEVKNNALKIADLEPGYKVLIPEIVHGTTTEMIQTIFPSIIPMFIAIPSFALLYSMDEHKGTSSLNGMDLANKCGIAVMLGFPAMSMGAPTTA
ncbi:hypothetical protein Taro_035343 [Colocasia esculenta]|uniref:Cytochrome oxidase subunit II transmembrane region profile domain-containing protein n=1 Tax=Colocasia esculenta TaxID=4460 RepID=A0A843W3J6_COLES|nr:hypothetical protein [Colocasia esculenta]